MSGAEFFYTVPAGEGQWVIKHQITDIFAGTVTQTSVGLVLRDENSALIGSFSRMDDVLRNLYAVV